MWKWIKKYFCWENNIFGKGSEEDRPEVEPFSEAYERVIHQPPPPVIGEPVLSIIRATSDVDRWSVVPDDNRDYITLFSDNRTGETYAYGMNRCLRMEVFKSWLTDDEQEMLTKAFRGLINAKEELEKKAERDRVLEVYCGGKSDES